MNIYCLNCHGSLGKNSPKQLCYKTYCPTTYENDIETIRMNLLYRYKDELKYYNKLINKYIRKFKENNNNRYMKFIRYYDKKIYNTNKKFTRIY